MKILVTGATGFVGGAITRYFAAVGHEIIATGRNKSARMAIEKYGRFLEWDIIKPRKIQDVEICIHAAGFADDQASYHVLHQANVRGTQNVIDSISCRKLIYISSSSVYDFNDALHTEDEEIDKRALGNYGRTKYEGEEVLVEHASNYESCTILRPRIIYGKGDRLLIPRLIEQSTKGKIKVPGNLEINTSACNIDLLIQVIEQIIKSHQGFDIFNVVDPQTYRMKELFSGILRSYYGSAVEFTHLPLPVLKPIAKVCDFLPWRTALSSMAVRNLSREKILSTEKLMHFLQAKPTHNFYNELEPIITWYKEAIRKSQNQADLAWANL